MMERQIQAVLSQSVSVDIKDVHVWYNDGGVVQPPPQDKNIKIYRCNWNTKFFGRFTVPLLCKTQYVAIFDDDQIPGPKWLESCLNVINTDGTNGVLGGAGVVVLPQGRRCKIGWNGSRCDIVQRVDFVGQTWFFRQEWAKYMWYESPVSWDNGEDIMFGYLVQKYGGIRTFVPPHPESDLSVWSTNLEDGRTVGQDRNASWRLKGHTDTRIGVIQQCINNGWDTINHVK